MVVGTHAVCVPTRIKNKKNISVVVGGLKTC